MKKRVNTNSKKLLVHFLFIMSILLVLGSTYAWVSGKDERVNKFNAPNGKLDITIEGILNPLTLNPGNSVDRNITVRNNSDQSVFVRVSIDEIMAKLKIDTIDRTGNAHIKNFKSVTPVPTANVKLEDASTWILGAYYQPSTDYIYQIADVLTYRYLDTQTDRHADLSRLDIGMPNVETNFATGKSNYWLYHDKYFYYSEPVLPQVETAVLISTISIPSDLPNRLKGSLYQQDIDAEGVLRNNTVFEAWNIPKTVGNPVYDLFSNRLN